MAKFSVGHFFEHKNRTYVHSPIQEGGRDYESRQI